MRRVTLDSNVYLSGFVFGGKPKRVLEMAIDGEIEVAVSDPIIQEVRRHLLGKFGWSEPRAAEAVESITEFAKHVTPTEAIDTVPTDPDDNRVLECAGSQTRSLDDDVLGTNHNYDWKRFGDSISTLGQGGSAAFVERRATEEGVDPVQNRSERGFAQAPHPSSRSLKEERTTTSDQHSETVH